jgi:hypothetical protein
LDELLARAPRTKRAADCDGEQHGEYERGGTEYTPTHDLRSAGASAQRDHSALPRTRTERDPGGNHSHGAKQPAREPANKTVELERLRDDADPGKAEQADRDERTHSGALSRSGRRWIRMPMLQAATISKTPILTVGCVVLI